MSVKSIWVMTSVTSLISMLSFCLFDLSIGESGVLKFPTISVWGLMYALSLLMFLLHTWVLLYFGHRCSEISSWWIFPDMSMKWPSLSLMIDFILKSILLDIRIAIIYLFPTLYTEVMSVFEVEVHFLHAAKGLILFSSSFC